MLAAAVLAGLVLADRVGLFGRAPTPDREKYDGRQFKIVYVVDGDTVRIDCPDGRRNYTIVRLLGVDTPEVVKPNTPPQYFGPEASRFTKQIALGRTIAVQLDHERTRDGYGRLLAYLMLADGKNLDLEIVEQGYGYADPRFPHPMEREFQRAQKQAKDAARGLWKDARDEDLPYYYRGKLKLPSRPATAPAR